jgi:hypothetical protein
MNKKAPLIRSLFVASFMFCVLGAVVHAQKAPTISSFTEVYLHGEKPVGRNLPKDGRNNGKVALVMARNEFETILVRTPMDGREFPKVENYVIRWNSDKLPFGIFLKVYAVGSQYFNKASAGSGASGEVPEIVVPIDVVSQPGFRWSEGTKPSKTILLFEIYTAPNTVVGQFDGVLEVSINAKKFEMPISIHVHDLVLSERFDLQTSFGFAPWAVLKKHYGRWVPEEADLYQKYFQLAGEHRVDLHKIYANFPDAQVASGIPGGSSSLKVADPPSITPTGAPIKKRHPSSEMPDLLATSLRGDLTFAKLLDLARGKSVNGYRWRTLDLPVPEKFKYPDADGKFAVEAENFWRALNASVLQRGLKDDTFVYFVDEPKPEQFPKIQKSIKALKVWAPDIKFLITAHAHRDLDSAVQIWCPNLSQWDRGDFPPSSSYLRRKKERGEQFWLYTSCNAHGCSNGESLLIPDLVTDRPSAFVRAFPWVAYRYGADGILYYDTVLGYGQKSSAPWRDGFNFSGYGEGNLFYPCNESLCGIKDQLVFASLRLKALRDGLEDVQILSQVAKAKLPVAGWVHDIVPSAQKFPKSTSVFAELKAKSLQEYAIKASASPQPDHSQSK